MSLLKKLEIYWLVFGVQTFLFLGLLNTGILSQNNVLFFRGIFFIGFSGLITTWLALKLKQRWLIGGLTMERVITGVVMSMCLNLVVFVLLPVTMDRSVSIYLLSRLSEAGSTGMDNSQLISEMEKGYVENNGAVDRRVTEQIMTGFVTTKENSIILTNKGKLFLNLAKNISKVYGLYN